MDTPPARLAALGQALLDLLERSQTCVLFHDEDECHITYTTTGPEAVVRSAARGDVLDCLQAALAVPAAAKACQGPCGRSLPLDAFPHDPSVRSGRKAYCRQCNNSRRRPPRAA